MTGSTLLKDLDIDRVDAVDRPAHKSQFLILKSEDAEALRKGVDGLAASAGALLDAVRKNDAAAIKAAVAPLAAILEKDLSDADQGMAGGGADGNTSPEVQADEIAEDVKTGEDLADDLGVAKDSGGAQQGQGGNVPSGKQPSDMKGPTLEPDVRTGEDVAKFCVKCSAPLAATFARKAYVTKAACPMCGAPTDTAGKYTEGGDASAAPGPVDAAAAKADLPFPGAAKPFGAKDGAKATDEEDKKDGGADEAAEDAKKKPFDPSIFAKAVAEATATATAAAVAKAIESSMTKFTEAQRAAAPGPVTKSRQAADEVRPVTKSGAPSFADIVFGQGQAQPRG